METTIDSVAGYPKTQQDSDIRNGYCVAEYVNKIIENSEKVGYIGRHKTYKLKNGFYISIWEYEGKYLGGCQYKNGLDDLCWTLGNVKDFYNDYLDNKDLSFQIISFRKYGQPKLNKPKELNKIKQLGSVDYIPKHCSCPVFVKDNDVYIKHRDYFSEQFVPSDSNDLGKPLNYTLKKYFPDSKQKKEKFVYSNNWSGVILRNEAWIKLNNLVHIIKRQDYFEPDVRYKIVGLQEQYHHMRHGELMSSDMERMWERLLKLIKEEVK